MSARAQKVTEEGECEWYFRKAPGTTFRMGKQGSRYLNEARHKPGRFAGRVSPALGGNTQVGVIYSKEGGLAAPRWGPGSTEGVGATVTTPDFLINETENQWMLVRKVLTYILKV